MAREAILRSASEAFGRRGYEGTTTREIARDSGVGEPTLYRLVGNKEALFLAVLDRIARRRLAHCEKELCFGGGWLDGVQRAAREDKRQDRSHFAEIRFLHNAMGTLSTPRIRKAVGRYYRRFADFNLRMIRQAASEGRFRTRLGGRQVRWLAWLDVAAGMAGGMLRLMGVGDLIDPEHYPWMLERVYGPLLKREVKGRRAQAREERNGGVG